MLWHPKTLQNLAMYNVFFIFGRFSICRKATKMTQNSISIPSCAQTPKNPRKMSKTPPYSGLGAKPFLGSGLGAKPFLGPPPAKADIATAILTNVIEHLVLLLPPNKHAFTAKAVWADLHVFCYNVSPKHLFLQCFQCSGIQKPYYKILLCTMFFSFLAVFPLPESYQNDPKFHFNTLLRSDTQKSSKNVENTTEFSSRCETVFGPPPAKADIATAILTNVIEHLV